MTIEEKLKTYILSKHKSVRGFAQKANLPYTTVMTVLNRGVSNASAGTILQLCNALDIDANSLFQNKIDLKSNYVAKLDNDQFAILIKINDLDGKFNIPDSADDYNEQTIINYLLHCGFIVRIPDADVDNHVPDTSAYKITEKGKSYIFTNYRYKDLSADERDLLKQYRQLPPNSKQIALNSITFELSRLKSVEQGETPIKILPKTKKQLDADIEQHLSKKSQVEKEQYFKVYNQSAAAGYGNYLSDDDDFDMVKVPSIPHGAEFGVRISGDSMQPDIQDGDIVFVERQANLDVGDIGIFIYDGDAYCKQLTYKDGIYYLHSLNSKYKDIAILSDSVYTVGRVLDNYNEREND